MLMKVIRLTALVQLFGLLFVMHALQSYSVHAHDGETTIAERLVSAQKEVLDGLRGRKMGGHEVAAAKASRNSGKSNDAEIMSTGKFQDQVNTQVIGMNNKVEAKTRDFAGLGIPRSTDHHPSYLPKSMQFEHSEVVIPPKTSLETVSRSDKPAASQEELLVFGKGVESKRLLEAAKEIVNLIHKDYRGNDKPHPPSNNNVPRFEHPGEVLGSKFCPHH